MEPYWNQMRIEQVIGRGVRRNSHIALPANERNVEIFRYFSVFSKNNMPLSRDKLTTDEHIEQLSLKKQNVINEVIQIFKECAFDCLLNAPDIKGDYSCFNFGIGAEGFSYHINLSKDIVESYTVQNKKKVERVFTRVFYCDKLMYLLEPKKKIFYLYHDDKKTPVIIDTKKTKALFVDKKTNEVFESVDVSAGNPVKIGFINEKNELKKKL